MLQRKSYFMTCFLLAFVYVIQFVVSNDVQTFHKFDTELRRDASSLGDLEFSAQGEYETFGGNATDCDCGANAKSCDFKEGLKVCTCNEGFVPGHMEICTVMCNETNKCLNGGTCYNSICLCPPRTAGSYCEKISVKCQTNTWELKARYRNLMCCCPNFDKNSTAKCKYDVEKHDAYCECPRKGEVYDGDAFACKDCNCGKTGTWKKCEFINQVKRCTCIRHYEYNPKTEACEPNYCGEGSKTSEFTRTGEIKCTCFDGYQQWKGKCVKCDCGSKGVCELNDGKPFCFCHGSKIHPVEAQEFEGKCLDCNCGKHGECVYDKEFKKVKCECYEGFIEHQGVCKYCYCGDSSTCSFNSTGVKTCNCPSGYKDSNGFCVDIDECQDPKICPLTEKCVNVPGSYVCGCADGYSHTDNGCTDIDECLDKNTCIGSNTECLNTPGSFECLCKSGYLARGGSNKSLKCEKNVAEKVGYGVMSALFVVIIIGLGVILYKMYRSSRF